MFNNKELIIIHYHFSVPDEKKSRKKVDEKEDLRQGEVKGGKKTLSQYLNTERI